MRFIDLIRLSSSSIFSYRVRSTLTALGIAVGIAAVVLLTSIGEGIHRFVLAEFTQFGTNLIAVNPGKTTTQGTPLGILGTVRPLSLEDAEALARVPYATAVVPVMQGNAEVEGGEHTRRTTVLGVGSEFPQAFSYGVGLGRFLPSDDSLSPRAFAVLGSKLYSELFGKRNPLGEKVRVGSEHYRVIGVMESKGQVLGFDLDDTVYIPAVRALELFNRDSLMEIDVVYEADAPPDEVVGGIKRILSARHGKEDYTITTQQQMLDVLGSVLSVLTFAVGALGGISLFVGGVGILTIMTIAVRERTAEIGLLRALGAAQGQVLLLFLSEAVMLSGMGGVAGLLVGAGGAQLLHLLVPALPVKTPWMYVVLAELVALGVGLITGVVPAHRASRLDPVESLRAE